MSYKMLISFNLDITSQIVNKNNTPPPYYVMHQVIKDYHLMIAVAVVTSFDITMLTLQEIISPVRLLTINSTIEVT